MSDFATHAMKSKLKIIIITFLATTAFWCLAVVGFFWWASSDQSTGVTFMEDARKRGFVAVMKTRNAETQPVTFTVEEVCTNATGMDTSDTSRVVLLERQLPPSGEFSIGIGRTENK